MDHNLMVLLQKQDLTEQILKTNDVTERFGITLSEEAVGMILSERKQVLREQRRVEFGEGIVPKLIFEFCDSAYVDQDNFVDMIIRLQEIFYLYKNETLDAMTDEELLHLMKEQFEHVCFGDLDYMEGTGLAELARAVRMGE